MKLKSVEKKEDAVYIQDLSPLQVFSDDGQLIVDINPGLVATYRRWYTAISREEPLPKRIGLVSALRGEGVTTVSLGLVAVMAADLETNIALVECNWWWPGLSTIAKIPPKPGLSELVMGKATLEEVSCHCSLPNLTLIPAGEMPEHDRSRISRSTAMVNTIISLSEQFDFLLLDIPAILKVKDSPVLAGLCQSICVVIRQGLTPVAAVKKALDEIEHLRIRGVVLNGAHLEVPKSIVTNIKS